MIRILGYGIEVLGFCFVVSLKKSHYRVRRSVDHLPGISMASLGAGSAGSWSTVKEAEEEMF